MTSVVMWGQGGQGGGKGVVRGRQGVVRWWRGWPGGGVTSEGSAHWAAVALSDSSCYVNQGEGFGSGRVWPGSVPDRICHRSDLAGKPVCFTRPFHDLQREREKETLNPSDWLKRRGRKRGEK